jgi:hypothetical protein
LPSEAIHQPVPWDASLIVNRHALEGDWHMAPLVDPKAVTDWYLVPHRPKNSTILPSVLRVAPSGPKLLCSPHNDRWITSQRPCVLNDRPICTTHADDQIRIETTTPRVASSSSLEARRNARLGRFSGSEKGARTECLTASRSVVGPAQLSERESAWSLAWCARLVLETGRSD